MGKIKNMTTVLRKADDNLENSFSKNNPDAYECFKMLCEIVDDQRRKREQYTKEQNELKSLREMVKDLMSSDS